MTAVVGTGHWAATRGRVLDQVSGSRPRSGPVRSERTNMNLAGPGGAVVGHEQLRSGLTTDPARPGQETEPCRSGSSPGMLRLPKASMATLNMPSRKTTSTGRAYRTTASGGGRATRTRKDEQRLIVVAYRERATHDHSHERVDVRLRERTPFGYAVAPGRERPSSSTAQSDHLTSSAHCQRHANLALAQFP